MTVDQQYVDGLINNPRERLSVELKDWFDPRSEEGKAKIVRTCLAMRNHDGGFLQVGFANQSGRPNLEDAPADPRAQWDGDEIQRLITNFASEPFEVHVRFGCVSGRDDREFPVVEVEAGVRSPVASKAEIPKPGEPTTKLVKKHAVYVRSLSSNGTVSTTEARYGDWPDLVRRCFDNREADIGGFARRHLSAMSPAAAQTLAGALASVAFGPAQGRSVEAEIENFRRDCYQRFQRAKIARNLTMLPRHGSFEVSVIVDGAVPERRPTTEFLDLLGAANPAFTGWPMWIDSRGFPGRSAEGEEANLDPEPYVYEGGWEAFVYEYEPESWYNHLDFWRCEPSGKFYQYRALEDDITEGSGYPEAMQELDFTLVTVRVAEAIAVPLAFGRAMGLVPEETTLNYQFLWSGLNGRRLSSWSEPGRSLVRRYVCHQHEQRSPVIRVPLETPGSALAPFVRRATSDLFASFGGFEAGEGVVEQLTDRMLRRNL